MEDLVTVATYQFAIQAEMARVALEHEGISAFTSDSSLVGANWFLGNAIGYVKLQVPRSQAAAARAVMRSQPNLMDDRQPGASPADDDDVARCLSCGADFPEAGDRCPACGWSYGTSDDDDG